VLLIRHRQKRKQLWRLRKLVSSNEVTAQCRGGSIGSTKLLTRPANYIAGRITLPQDD
jgi:hypothetical protein